MGFCYYGVIHSRKVRYPDLQKCVNHRVDRVPGFFSSRPNWDSPSPSGESVPPPFGSGGEVYTLAEGRGGGGPSSDEGTDTVVLYEYMYFVVSTDGWGGMCG
jgi:hypothetical protein